MSVGRTGGKEDTEEVCLVLLLTSFVAVEISLKLKKKSLDLVILKNFSLKVICIWSFFKIEIPEISRINSTQSQKK